MRLFIFKYTEIMLNLADIEGVILVHRPHISASIRI
jgi:hypothetical protein